MLNKLTDYKFVGAVVVIALGTIALSKRSATVQKITG